MKTLLTGLFCVMMLFMSPSNNLGQSAQYVEQEVRFKNGETELVATLFLPQRSTRPPGVVIIHGSGRSDRSNAWTKAYAKALAERGLAVLYPDKRGSGGSKGDWKTASFSDLAGDAIAAVEKLRENEQIDKERIGVIGFSQGGHVAPLAAAKSGHITFAVSISGSTVPILEQIADEIEMNAERSNLTPEQINLVKEINQKALGYALTGKGWETYKTLLDTAKSGELQGQKIIEGFPAQADHWFAEHIRAIGNYDPMIFWQKLSQPILFVYGKQDTNVRVDKSVERIEKNLGSRNYTLMLFRQNGHTLFREDLLDFLARWIKDR